MIIIFATQVFIFSQTLNRLRDTRMEIQSARNYMDEINEQLFRIRRDFSTHRLATEKHDVTPIAPGIEMHRFIEPAQVPDL